MKTARRTVTAASRSTRVIPSSASNTLDPETSPWIVPASWYLRRRWFFIISPFLIFNPSAVLSPTDILLVICSHAYLLPLSPYNTAVSVFVVLSVFVLLCVCFCCLCSCCGGFF